MRKTVTLCIMFLSFLFHPAFAQEREISGKITSSEDGAALPGATVVVKGTTIGTATGPDGSFKLKVPADAKTLVISSIGMAVKEFEIGDKTTVNVALSSDQKKLEEVVVVGYTVQSKKDVTGAISTIKGETLKEIPVQSFDQALSGQASGVNIVIPNGVLNNAPVIRVRGFNSITSSSYPLIVVDGIPIITGDRSGNSAANNPLGDINPADIESIDVLKDASATAIYGSRAANGVMVITTKKGKENPNGKAKVSYSSWVGLTQAFNLPEVLNANQYMEIKNEARKNAGLDAAFFPSYNPDGSIVDTRWSDIVYRNGVSHNNHLSIAGATPSTGYYFSAGYTNQEGFIKKNEFNRKAVRFNIDQKVLNRVKLGANINFTNSYNAAPNTGSLPGQGFGIAGIGRMAMIQAPNVFAVNPDGSYNITTSNTIGPGKNLVTSNYYNPVPLMDLNKFTSSSSHLMTTVFGEVELLKGLTFKSMYTIDDIDVEDFSFSSALHGDGFANKGIVTSLAGKLHKWGFTNTLNLQKTLSEKHNVGVLVGTEQLKTTIDAWGGTRQGIADDFFESYQGYYLINNPPTAQNFQTENAFLSYFGRATYDFNKKYFLTGSLRYDGFSGLSAGNKFGNFGGFSVGWSVSEENFYKNSSLSHFLNSLKIRSSYGKVGNMGVPDFGSLYLYNASQYGDVGTVFFSQAGNPDLRWETSTKMDAGFTLGFLQERIQLEASYFNNNVNGLILNSPQSPSKGIPGNAILKNSGSMYNQGIETGITSTNIDKTNFSWSSNLNFTWIVNEVTALAEGNADIVGITSGLERTNITRVGYSVGSLYAVKTKGVNPKNGQRIFINKDGQEVQYSHPGKWTYVKDGSPAPPVSGEDAVVVGNAIPKWYGGFNNTFKYKDFLDLTIGITYSGGNYIYNGSKAGMRDQRFWNNSVDVMDRWTYEGQVTDIPRVVYNDNVSNGSSFPISDNVEKGDFIKLRNINLGYIFRERVFGKTGISSLRIYAQVSNLYTLTEYTGSDPEISVNGNSNISPGVDRNSVPQARTFTFGLNLVL